MGPQWCQPPLKVFTHPLPSVGDFRVPCILRASVCLAHGVHVQLHLPSHPIREASHVGWPRPWTAPTSPARLGQPLCVRIHHSVGHTVVRVQYLVVK